MATRPPHSLLVPADGRLASHDHTKRQNQNNEEEAETSSIDLEKGEHTLQAAHHPRNSNVTETSRRETSFNSTTLPQTSINSTTPLQPDEVDSEASPIASSFSQRLLKQLVHMNVAHRWYWLIAVVAPIPHIIQIGTMGRSILYEMIGKSLLVYPIFFISVLEQVIAWRLNTRQVKVPEAFTSLFVFSASVAAWTIWALRHRNPRSEFLALALFHFIDVALFVRSAYVALVEPYENHSTNDTLYRRFPNDFEHSSGSARTSSTRSSLNRSGLYLRSRRRP